MNVLNREDLFQKEISDIQAEMSNDVNEFIASLETKTEEELKELEAELMKVFDENDEYIKNVKYQLPDESKFDDKTVKASDIHSKIIYFLNRLEVEWKATLGIYQMIQAWKHVENKEVPYGVFDSTLRTLGTMKFKGEQECLDILLINNFMSNAHDQYVKDTTWIQYLSALHNAILQQLSKVQDKSEPVGDGPKISE